MSDLIERQDAIDAISAVNDSICGQQAIDALCELPSAQPEIVRCKDCKYYDGRPCGIVDWYNTADDFCSSAERRTDEQV